MEQLGLPPDTMRRRVEETLDLLGIAELRDRDLRTLSGGQQQRVAIGSVLTMHPRLLVLDEPTSALDPTAAEDVLATLTRLVHDLGLTVLMAEHRLERVVPFADRICLLTGDGGIRVGDPATMLADSPVVPPLVELGRLAGWSPLPLAVREARRAARGAQRCRRRRSPSRRAAGASAGWPAEASPSATAPPSPSASVDLDPGRRHRHRPDGPQRVRASPACSGRSRVASGTPDGSAVAGVDPAARGAGAAAASWSGWCRRRPPTCSTWRRSPRSALPATVAPAGAARCSTGSRPASGRHAPARPLRGPAAGAGAGAGAGRPARAAAARRADPRPRLPRQGGAGGDPARARRRGDGGARRHPRRRVRRAGGRRPAGHGRGRAGVARPGARGRRPVAGLRAAGDQGAGSAVARRSPTCGVPGERATGGRRPALAALRAGARGGVGDRADDAVLAAAAAGARRGSGSRRRSCSSRCCR